MDKQLIIHATGTFAALKSILKSSSLQLSYSKEDFCIGKKKISSAAHPMVCFCECSQNEIKNKRITYGRYGIAFSTDWALKKGISPVLYIDGNSLAAKGLESLLRARQNKESSKLSNNLRLSIMEIKCFTKNVRGYNSYLKQSDFDFKSENEWRYVPRKSDIGGNLISQNKSTYLKRPDYYNKKIAPFPLRFTQSKIEVIFVSNSIEASEIARMLPIAKHKIQVSEWKT